MLNKLLPSIIKITLLTIILVFLLFANGDSNFSHHFIEPALKWIADVCRDPETQWMVVLSCVTNVLLLVFFFTGNLRSWHLGNPNLWLVCILLVSVLLYAIRHSTAIEALIFFANATLSQGMVTWSYCGIQNSKLQIQNRFYIVCSLIILLISASIKQAGSLIFEYNGQVRLSGPWNNPNIFGVLMGMGAVLSLNILVFNIHFFKDCNTKIRKYGFVFLFMFAAMLMFRGLLKSHSRGAWIGAATGIVILIYQVLRLLDFSIFRMVLSIQSMLLLLFVSTSALSFWNFRHAECLPARRFFSISNLNDFSWRNRIASYEGGLQMIADRPWFGFGWDQPQLFWDKFYRKPKINEAAAIQSNDYFTLGATLGIPALGCFVAYIWLSLRSKGEVRSAKWGVHAPRVSCSAPSRNTLSSLPATEIKPPAYQPVCEAQGTAGATMVSMNKMDEEEWLRMTCRAGAIVLLVGFFFDGGLFKLATGATFWILLELGSERSSVQSSRFNIQSSGDAEVCA